MSDTITTAPAPEPSSTVVAVPSRYADLVESDPGAFPLLRRLRTEGQLIGVPAATVAISGGIDMWLHTDMITALHAGPMGFVYVLVGMAVNSVAALTSGLVLSHHGMLNKEELPLKDTLWASVASGGVLTLIGPNPLAIGGYTVLAAIKTAVWHKSRLKARRALRKALRDRPPAVDLPPMTAIAPPAHNPLDPIGALVDIVGYWVKGVASSGPLSQSNLAGGELHDEGRLSFIVNSGPQGLLLETVNANRNQIASALHLKLPDADGRGGQDVVFDQPGGLGLNRGQLRMQIINLESNAARSRRFTPEISHAPGNPYSVRIGGYIDDGGDGYWDFADRTGVWSGLICGGTGLGKSSLVEVLAYIARRLGFHTLFLDPQSGASSPILAKHATYPLLGLDNSVAALDFLEGAAGFREQWLALHPSMSKILPNMIAPCRPDGLAPDPTCPCGGVTPPPILGIIEECDQVFNATLPGSNIKLGELFGKLAKRIRKLGMGLLAVTQLGELKTFGGSDMLRSNLPVRNLLAMHITSNVGGQLVPGLPYSPKLLPKINGRALLCGQASRVMELMLDWLTHREDADTVGGIGPFAEDLFEALPTEIRFAADQHAANRWLPTSGDATGVAQNDAREKVAAMLAGTSAHLALPAVDTAAPTPPAPGQPGQPRPVTAPGLSWPEPVTVICAAPTVEELESMYEIVTEDNDEPDSAAERNAEETIWALLLSGVTQTGDLIRLSQYSETHVRNIRKRLVAAGRVRDGGHGRWEPIQETT